MNIQPPAHDLELEQNILGAILLCKAAFAKVAHLLTPEIFYSPYHQTIYKACVSLYKQNKPIDLITINQELRKTGKLGEANGIAYVAGITNRVCSDANIEYWAVILVQYFMERELYSIGVEITQAKPEDIFDLYSHFEKQLNKIQNDFRKEEALTLSDACKNIIKNLSENTNGIPSGFATIQEFVPGNIYVLAARPGMGKTSLMMNMAFNQARLGIPIGVFSLEMTYQQLIARSSAALLHINSHKLVHPHLLTSEERLSYEAKLKEISKWPIYVADNGGKDLDDFRIQAKRMVQRDKVKIIYIDYLQLMDGGKKSDKRNESREQEITRISKGLKSIAKELQVPIVELAQLSRANEREKEKRPTLISIRESGSIEQDADCVYFIYRDDYYNRDEPDGTAELIIAKNRFGPLGTVSMLFDAAHSKFTSL